MSMRILHVLDHSIPLQSGYTFRTRAILREQRRLGWETFHLTSPKHSMASPPEEDVDGLHFYRTPWRANAWRKLPVAGEVTQMQATKERLTEIARLVRPDVLHAHSPVLNALPTLAVGRQLGIPVVYEVRAFWEDAAVDHGTSREGGARYRATRALETHALRRVHHVTTICEGLKQDIVERGIGADRVTVIPNAVDLSSFIFDAEPDHALKSRLGLQQALVVGFIGSFYAYEGLDILLCALPRMLERVPRLRLLLVGGGPEEEKLKALAKALGIADKVSFAGRVPHAEVQSYYSVVDIFAYPRRSMRLTELVTPLKPLEAMAQGRMLIASDVGGHRELIRDGRTGTLFRAGSPEALTETLVGLIERRDSWPEMRMFARQFVESERSWVASVERYREVYRRVLATPTLAYAA